LAAVARQLGSNGEFGIVVVSGRYEKCRQGTEQWLQKHGIPYLALFMRRDGDKRGDELVKAEILTEHILPRFDVVGAGAAAVNCPCTRSGIAGGVGSGVVVRTQRGGRRPRSPAAAINRATRLRPTS
jgi:hypothetical protein